MATARLSPSPWFARRRFSQMMTSSLQGPRDAPCRQVVSDHLQVAPERTPVSDLRCQTANPVIASDSEAIQSNKERQDCFVARAPRNDAENPSWCPSSYDKRAVPHSRGMIRPGCCINIVPLERRGRRRPSREGAGKTGCALHPRSHVQLAHLAKNAHEHTGSAENIRPSLRNGLRLISCSPR